MRGYEKIRFLEKMEVNFDEKPFIKYIKDLNEKDLLKLLRKKRTLLHRNTMFVKKIKHILNRQIELISNQILFQDVEVIHYGGEITIGRL